MKDQTNPNEVKSLANQKESRPRTALASGEDRDRQLNLRHTHEVILSVCLFVRSHAEGALGAAPMVPCASVAVELATTKRCNNRAKAATEPLRSTVHVAIRGQLGLS